MWLCATFKSLQEIVVPTGWLQGTLVAGDPANLLGMSSVD
jgi:hypothetical protein